MHKRLIAAIITLATAVGCGRSDLTNYLDGDGGPDGIAAPCNVTTCSTGCCDSTGTCQQGTALKTCGFGGTACNNCLAEGFQFCDQPLKACGDLQPTCNPTTCASGCCTMFEGQPACVSGRSSLACGTGAAACTNCTMMGEACDGSSQACVNAPCGPSTCSTCCSGGACVGSPSDAECGLGGLACTDCTVQGEYCNPSTGSCGTVETLCTPSSCPTGCCAGDACVTNEPDTQCGLDGLACADCTAMSEACTSGVCASPCTLMTCPGCCLTGTCFAGFLDTQCGSGGVSCTDCTATSETCDITTTPRVCQTVTTCPASYTSCASTVTTPTLTVSSGACTTSDIANAHAACSGGFSSSPCQSFFSAEPIVNPKCASCLSPFQYDIPSLTGIFNCASPYVSSSCNHDTGCGTDCEQQSCGMCSPSTEAACLNGVIMGQCSSYVSMATSCIGPALVGAATFCNGVTYLGNYGDWLAAVGAHYCE